MKNADKMNKAAIWQWFIGQTPPTYKRPRGKNAKERDEYSISYAAIVNGDRLIIGIWQGCKAKPLGVYYMTPGGSANTCTDGKNWHSGKLECIPGGGYSYWYCSYKYQWDMIYGKEEALEWLETTFDEDGFTYSYCTTVKDMVDRIETNIGFIKRRNARQRKEAKISAWANSMPPLPSDFDTWMHETVFSGVHYAFYLKTKNKYYCTACGKEHIAKDWKHLNTYTCSRTGKTVKVDKVQSSHSARERIMLVQSHYDIDGNICSVARHLSATAEWSISGYKQRAWSECIIPLPLNGGRVDASKIVYNHGGDKWSDKNVYGYQHKRCYCYPDVSALQGTLFGDIAIAIDAAAAKGWKLNYSILMRGWYDDPRMEYLIKGNFRQLVDDITMFVMDYNAVLMPGNTIKDVLGIDGQGVNRLRDHNGGAYYTLWLRTAFMCDYKLPEETVQYFVKNKISPQDVAFALNCGMSPVQVANYLQKPHEYSDKLRSYYVKSKVFTLLHQWRDYIDMAEKLKLDKHNPAVHKPKDLKARHDELVEILNAQRDELEKERIESEYPNVKPVCDKIKAMYEWGDGIHEVVVPSGAAEIMREGRLLSHCVGSSDRYFDRIAAEESYVMFLRHSSDRDKPWYTLEVEPGGCIRQLRTIGDAEGEDRAEAKEFLTKWRKEISRRVGKAEQEAAIISREKRLAEFAELRRNGNVIRNGRLAGKLLVDVLEADFKEYNTEYVTA